MNERLTIKNTVILPRSALLSEASEDDQEFHEATWNSFIGFDLYTMEFFDFIS